jgi:hypothetical protein
VARMTGADPASSCSTGRRNRRIATCAMFGHVQLLFGPIVGRDHGAIASRASGVSAYRLQEDRERFELSMGLPLPIKSRAASPLAYRSMVLAPWIEQGSRGYQPRALSH